MIGPLSTLWLFFSSSILNSEAMNEVEYLMMMKN